MGQYLVSRDGIRIHVLGWMTPSFNRADLFGDGGVTGFASMCLGVGSRKEGGTTVRLPPQHGPCFTYLK